MEVDIGKTLVEFQIILYHFSKDLGTFMGIYKLSFKYTHSLVYMLQ